MLDRVDTSLATLPSSIEFGWQVDAPEGVFVDAVGVGAVVLVSAIADDGATEVIAYDAETGAAAWLRSFPAERTVRVLAVGDAIVVESA